MLPDEVKKSIMFAKLSFIAAPIFNFFSDNSLFLIPKFGGGGGG